MRYKYNIIKSLTEDILKRVKNLDANDYQPEEGIEIPNENTELPSAK
jgi:uncharacterized protein (UPF0305 family)